MEGEKNKEKHLALVSVFAGYRCLHQGVQNYSERGGFKLLLRMIQK